MPLPWLMVYFMLLCFYFFVFIYINYLGSPNRVSDTFLGVKKMMVVGGKIFW